MEYSELKKLELVFEKLSADRFRAYHEDNEIVVVFGDWPEERMYTVYLNGEYLTNPSIIPFWWKFD